MKKLIYTIAVITLFIAPFKFVRAQGNLQFNQAEFVQFTVNAGSSQSPQSITVPTGKVWKIESASTTLLNGSTYYASTGTILLNGNIIWQSSVQNTLPVWLPAGSYTLTLANTTGTLGSGLTLHGSVSLIEFNIVQ